MLSISDANPWICVQLWLPCESRWRLTGGQPSLCSQHPHAPHSGDDTPRRPHVCCLTSGQRRPSGADDAKSGGELPAAPRADDIGGRGHRHIVHSSPCARWSGITPVLWRPEHRRHNCQCGLISQKHYRLISQCQWEQLMWGESSHPDCQAESVAVT